MIAKPAGLGVPGDGGDVRGGGVKLLVGMERAVIRTSGRKRPAPRRPCLSNLSVGGKLLEQRKEPGTARV